MNNFAPQARVPVLIDCQEKLPYTFNQETFSVSCTHLETGDYSIAGHEVTGFTVERKSLDDLVKTVTTDHSRFAAELKRLKTYKFAAILIEAGLDEITEQKYSSKNIKFEQVIGNVVSIIIEWRIPLIFASDRQNAIYILEKLILKYMEQTSSAFVVKNVEERIKSINSKNGKQRSSRRATPRNEGKNKSNLL